MNMTGKVVSINISEKKGVVKKPLGQGVFIKEHGLEKDAHAGKWHRQVSLLAQESINKMKKSGIKGLSPGMFAENITVEGIVLYELPIGARMKIGDTVLEVTQIGKECHGDCEIRRLVGDCVMPREGIFTRVIQGGIIKSGDVIEVYDK